MSAQKKKIIIKIDSNTDNNSIFYKLFNKILIINISYIKIYFKCLIKKKIYIILELKIYIFLISNFKNKLKHNKLQMLL